MTRRGNLLLILCLGLLIVGMTIFLSERRIKGFTSEQFLMDTLVSIKVYGDDTAMLKAATAAAYGEMQRIADLVNH